MKYKKYLLPALCLLLVISFIYFNRSGSTKTPETKPSKTDSSTDNKTTKEKGSSNNTAGNNTNSDVTSPQNDSTPKDITLLGTPINSMGNTSGNLLNGGLFAQQGNWMYFSSLMPTGTSLSFFRSMLDGETGFKTFENWRSKIGSINVVGEWLYFILYNDSQHIYKMKTDGSNLTLLSATPCSFLTVVGDWVYYIDRDLTGIYGIKTDGSTRMTVSNDPTAFFSVADGFIYYAVMGRTDYLTTKGIRKVKLDGSSNEKVTDEPALEFIISDGWIYYTDYSKRTFNRIKIDGTGKTKLMSFQDYMRFNISGEWIYFIKNDDSTNVYKMKTNGTNVTRMTGNDMIYTNQNGNSSIEARIYGIIGYDGIYIIGDSLYIYSQSGELNRLKLDGTLYKALN